MRSFNSYVNGIIINDIKGRRLHSLDSASGDIFSSTPMILLFRNIRMTLCCGSRDVHHDSERRTDRYGTVLLYRADCGEYWGSLFLPDYRLLHRDGQYGQAAGLVENTELTANSTLYILNNRDEVIASTNSNARGTLFRDVLSMDKDILLNGVKETIDGRRFSFRSRVWRRLTDGGLLV